MNEQRWYVMKDLIRVRARGKCEWCSFRPMSILHHRTYARNGQERPEDVMGVCSACHKAIHGLLPWTSWEKFRVGVDSLASRGDCGKGLEEPWPAFVTAAMKQLSARERARFAEGFALITFSCREKESTPCPPR